LPANIHAAAFDFPLRLCAFARDKVLTSSPDDSASENLFYYFRLGAKAQRKIKSRGASRTDGGRRERSCRREDLRGIGFFCYRIPVIHIVLSPLRIARGLFFLPPRLGVEKGGANARLGHLMGGR
jgi:hypothetical protein